MKEYTITDSAVTIQCRDIDIMTSVCSWLCMCSDAAKINLSGDVVT